MYIMMSKIENLPIISLQTGETVALTGRPVFEVAKLEILALRCLSLSRKSRLLLLTRDIRQFAEDCIIIDTEDELAEPDDVIRLQASLKAGYTPIGKTVVSESSARLGVVEDYSVNVETALVQALHLRGSFFRSWIGGGLIIDRSQIIDITPHQFTVRDATMKSPALPAKPMPESQP